MASPGSSAGEHRPDSAANARMSRPDSAVDLDTVKTVSLREIVVTARESGGMTSSSRIDRSAMQHLQPTSFTDLLELLPGNMSQTPDMGSANTITLRETGNLSSDGTKTRNDAYSITSLGTMFMVDGSPIVTDANMQGVPSSATEEPETKRDVTNRGVDMRTLSTDNIESVEIIRGIPSAEYGNLTSGLVNIRRIRRPTPFVARLKVDEFSKLISLAKGFELSPTTLINIDGGYLDSKADPRNNLENYKRINFSTRANFQWYRCASNIEWTLGFDYTGSFDNAKTDPDLSYNKINEYRSSYNRMALTSNLTVELNRLSWLKAVKMNTSVSYQLDNLKRRKQVAPQRASVAPTSMEAGVHDGHYLLSEYVADYENDGRPLSYFLKLSAEGNAGAGLVMNEYKGGGDWTVSKNFGKGQVYDLTRPLSASWTTRPRAFRDIPALHVVSFFAEDKITWTPAGNSAELQAGLRGISVPSLGKKYYLSGKVYIDPRINAVWNFPFINAGKHRMRFLVAGGYGMTTRMPTVDYLYPQVNFNDFIQLNYYDVNNPLENSRVNLRTYIDDPTNYDLKAARNRKWEVRIGGQLGQGKLSVTYFDEHLNSGFRYTTVYRPYTYTKYDASAIKSSMLSGPPELNSLPSSTARILDGYRKVTNGSRLDKRGIEFQFNTPRWKALCTSLTVTGAWFHSTYTNSQVMYATVNDVVNGTAVKDKYVGLYDTNEGRINQTFNSNFMFDTQIRKWGLVFTTSLQCLWFVKTRRMAQDGIPDYYISADDGAIHPFVEKDMEDPMLRYLVKVYNSDAFKTQTIPPAVYLNLKATKMIGKWLRISAFVNNIIDYLPDYKSNGLLIRRVSDTYFGAEINVTI